MRGSEREEDVEVRGTRVRGRGRGGGEGMMVVREQEAFRRPCAHGPLDKRSKGGAGRRVKTPGPKRLGEISDFWLRV